MESSCLICGGAVQQAGPPCCGACRDSPHEQLRANGFELEVERHLSKNGGVTVHTTAPDTATSQIAVVLSKEHLGRKVQKLFSDELQVGDDAFDAEVYVEYAEEEDAHVLRDTTVQSLVLQLVELGTLSITENHAKVHVRTHTSMSIPQIHMLLAMVVMALDRVRDQGSPC